LSKLKIFLIGLLSFFIVGAIGAYYGYKSFCAVPATRLVLDKFYAEMPQDERHRYIILPLDHSDPKSDKFKGFYIMSPDFKNDTDVVFFLTDGQMQLVGTDPDFSFFSLVVGDRPYVLIGARGHAPTLFPEVYNAAGELDYKKAMTLYGSDQQVEDIECVRLDMLKNGFISPDSKIMVFGASGAGVLAQQYLSKYGRSVSRAIIAVTGAPDIAIASGWTYSPDFKTFNLEGAKALETAVKKGGYDICSLSYILYQMARGSSNAIKDQNAFLARLAAGEFGAYFKTWIKPAYNPYVLFFSMKSPAAVSARVRWYELVANDLKKYAAGRPESLNLLYEYSYAALSDFLENDTGNIALSKNFKIDRAGFTGEVLVMCGAQDVVFSTDISSAIASQYPNSRLAIFNDGHRLMKTPDYYLELRKAFYDGGFASKEFLKLYNAANCARQ